MAGNKRPAETKFGVMCAGTCSLHVLHVLHVFSFSSHNMMYFNSVSLPVAMALPSVASVKCS